MELDGFLKERFNRLRHILELRAMKLKDMEKQVIDCFERGNLSEIERLMDKKNHIIAINHQLTLFIDKWENQSSTAEKDQLYTSF